jgi:chromosomal replication initiation ATPase DnaA
MDMRPDLNAIERHAICRFRKRGMPSWAFEIVKEVAYRHRVYLTDIASNNRVHAVVWARTEAMYRIKATKPALSSTQLGAWFDRDHTSILHGIAAHQERSGAKALVHYDLKRSRRRNAALSRFRQMKATSRALQETGQ